MNAQKIVDRMRDAKRPDELLALIRACATRREEIRARREQIAERHTSAPVAPERATAIGRGLSAVAELDAELVELAREHAYLDDLELKLQELREAAITEELRRAFPVARRRLLDRMQAVRDRLKALDDAIAVLRQDVETLAQFGRLPGQVFPLDDSELAELLELREAVWAVRTVATLRPPLPSLDETTAYERSRKLFFERVRRLGVETVRERQPPKMIHNLDLAGANVRIE